MVRITPPASTAALVVALSSLLAACGNDTLPFYCPIGQVLTEGRCVDVDPDAADASGDATGTDADTDVGEDADADVGEDAGEDGGTDATEDATADGGTDANEDAAGADTTEDISPDTATDVPGADVPADICRPFTRVCLDDATAAVCNAAGDAYSNEPCASSTHCVEGMCVARERFCEPGAVLGCDSDAARRVCNTAGSDYVVTPCDSSAPTCMDGECTNNVCAPGATTCDGPDRLACDSAGDGFEFVETCDWGCDAGRCLDPCPDDAPSHLGCTFWATDLDNYGNEVGEAIAAQFAIAVSNPHASAVDVDVYRGDGGLVQTVTVGPGDSRNLLLPRRDVNNTALTYNTYEVVSTAAVAVQQFNPLHDENAYSTDASLLLPSAAVGTEYVVNGWDAATAGDTFVAIVATRPGPTSVTITTPAAIRAGTSVAAMSAGDTRVFTLQQGQVLSLSSESTRIGGLTGMTISASQPVGVFAGAECAQIPTDNTYCDHLEEQLPPVSTWGTQIVGAKFDHRGTEPDIWRVVASEDGTTVTANPAIPVLTGRVLDRGDFVDLVVTDDFVLNASRPISVGQYMVGANYPGPGCDRSSSGGDVGCAIPPSGSCGSVGDGDPAAAVTAPTSQFRTEHHVVTDQDYTHNYVNIVAPSGATVTIDGDAPSEAPTTLAGWSIYRAAVRDGAHHIVGSAPIGVTAYGYACGASYAYPGGMNLAPR